MDDIFSLVRDGVALQVRIWLDNTENDLNQGFVFVWSSSNNNNNSLGQLTSHPLT